MAENRLLGVTFGAMFGLFAAMFIFNEKYTDVLAQSVLLGAWSFVCGLFRCCFCCLRYAAHNR